MWNFVFFFIITKNCPQDLFETMLTVSSLCSLTILKISIQVIRLGFEKICGNCLFTTSMDESIALRHRSGKPCSRDRARTLFSRLGTAFVALWPTFVKLKMCFGLGSDPCTVCYSTVTTTEHSPLKREYGDI